MANGDLVSIVIPARNEQYLQKTVQGLLDNAIENIEIIVVLDGYWPSFQEIISDERVHYIHTTGSRGMRHSINSAVSVARGKYILKSDAHCLFDKGYDVKLKANCFEHWVVVPRKYSLDKNTWTRKSKPPIDYMYLSNDFHGRPWDKKNNDKSLKNEKISHLMSFQGSCWFMHRKYYYELELLDEDNYGPFFAEAQEIGLKCWLSGGEVMCNKMTWYAHLHKDKEMGRGYRLNRDAGEIAQNYVERWRIGKVWHKQKYDLDYLIRMFKPVPTWQ